MSMATTNEDLARLLVSIEFTQKQSEKQLSAIAKRAGDTARGIENSFKKANGNVGKQVVAMSGRFDTLATGLATKIGGAFAAAASVRAAQQLIDTASRIQNALRVAGLEGDNLRSVYEQLYASAQQNAAPIESLVTLYGRLALVQKELGVDQAALIQFTGNVALALRVAGTDATAASGALLQLSQALGSGTVHAEEFNSILEGAPTIAQAAAAGLKEAGGSVAQLRSLVIDGKVSSQAFFAAFEAGAATLDGKVATSTLTVAQRFQQLENALVDAAGKFDAATDASGRLGTGIEQLSSTVSALGKMLVDVANSDVGVFIGKITEATGQVQQLLGFLGGIPGALDKIGKIQTDIITGKPIGTAIKDSANKAEADRIQARIDGAFAADPTTSRLPPAKTAPAAPVKPVSLSDFAPPAAKGGGSAGRKSKGGGGGSDSYGSEVQRIKEQTAALQAAYAAQSQLNPLVADYSMQVEKARIAHELMAAAQKSGVAITPALTASIEQLAQGYAQAADQVDRMQQAQDRVRDSAEDLKQTAQDVVGGFINDLRGGASAAEALSNALNKVLDKVIDIGLQSIFSGTGGGKGGLLGGILIPGVLHSGGVAGSDGYGHGRAVSPSTFSGAKRYHTGGVAGLQPGEVPAILQRGEVVLPRGTKMGGGQNVHVTVGVSADSNGNLMPFVENVSQGQVQKAAPRIVSAASKNVVPTMAAYQSNKAGAEWR